MVANKVQLRKLIQEILLQEYAQKIIDKILVKWKAESNNTASDTEILDAIKYFETIKGNITAKIKNSEFFRNSMPKKFYEPNPITKKGPLDPANIENYTWKDIEILFDQYGQTKSAKKTNEPFRTIQEADLVDVKGVPLIYRGGDGINIWEGSTYESCVRLNYVFKYKDEENKTKTYIYCIGRSETSANRYYSYRFGGSGKGALNRSFYFVADSKQSADLKDGLFINWYHYFVIHAFDNGNFGVTDSTNIVESKHEITNDGYGVSWDQLGQFITGNGGESGKMAWNKIKNLKDKFVYVEPPSHEVDKALIGNKILSFDQFKSLTREQKIIYINLKAGIGDENSPSRAFTPEMFAICDPEMKGIAISANDGYTPSFNEIKNAPPLIKRYVDYQLKRGYVEYEKTGEFKRVIPLPFVRYFDEKEKLKYLQLFEKKGLRFDLILQYFGENTATEYANKNANNLEYLPEEAVDYISDNNLKNFYRTYAKLFANWKLNKDSIQDFNQISSAPKQSIKPHSILSKDWNNLTRDEKEMLIEAYKQEIKSKGNKNMSFIYALPFILESQEGEYYTLIPSDDEKSSNNSKYLNWDLVDLDGNVIKHFSLPESDSSTPAIKAKEETNNQIRLNSNKSTILSSGYPSRNSGFERIYPLEDILVVNTPLTSLKESVYDDWEKYNFMRKAGILK